jgi:HlyD family secretion protein
MSRPRSSGFSATKLIIVIALLAAAAGGWYLFAGRKGETAEPEFVTAKVVRGDVMQAVTATGQLDPLITVDVGSQISGLVVELNADFNTEVKEGMILAKIDPATYQQRLRQAEADYASAEASNRLQKLNTERTRELFEKKLVTRQELDQAEAQLAQSNAQLLTRQAAVENAKVDLERCTIRSPIDGIVMSKQTEVGKTVAASLNAPVLFTIANDLSKMQITAAVSEADIGSVLNDQSVTFTVDAYPNRTFTGKVAQVRNAPKIASNVVTYDTIIHVDNRDLRLRPGMTANVSIVVARRDNVIRIPNAALRVRMPDASGNVAPAAPAPSPTASAPKAGGGGPGGTGGGGEGGGRRGEGGGRRGGGGMFGANLTDEQRAVVRQIMTEVGVDFRAGPPTEEQRNQIRKLMAERGLPVPEATKPGEPVITTRTVYVMRGAGEAAKPEPVSVKIGITDGSGSEVIDGLSEGELLVTGVSVPTTGAAASAPRPQNNPFGGPRRGF